MNHSLFLHHMCAIMYRVNLFAQSFLNSFSRLAIVALFIAGGSATLALAATTKPVPIAPAGHITALPNIQYSSVVDYTPTDVLLNELHFGTQTTYDCHVSSLTCSPSTATSLTPSSVPSIGSFVNPTDTLTITTTRIPILGPTFTLSKLSNNTLSKISTIPFGHEISRVIWSSDGKVLILMSADGSSAKYVVASNTLTPITSLPASGAWLTLSPDGHYLAYYKYATTAQASRTFGVVDTTIDKNYEETEPLAYWDLLTEGVRLFAFSPDSTKLVYLSDRNNYPTLYQVTLAKLATDTTAFTGTQLILKSYTVSDFQWISNTTLLFAANRENPQAYRLYTFNPSTSALAKVADNVSFDAAMQKIGTNILFATADQSGRFPKLFNMTTQKVSAFTIPDTTHLATSGNTSVTVDGVPGVWLKSNVATSTLLVWLHGGPDRQSSLDYNSYMSYGGYDWVLTKMQAAGVGILKLDYPGSVGYGRTYAESIKSGVGTVDVSKSFTAITDFAKARGYRQVYLMGNSYGGYLALKLLVTHPTSYQGALSLSGVTDWQTLLTDIPTSIFSVDFNGTPNVANQALYDAASIINNLNVISTQKIVIIQGDADTEVPYAQSTLLDSALTAEGKAHTYFTLPGEDHVYVQPTSFTLVCQQAFAFVGLKNSSSCTIN